MRIVIKKIQCFIKKYYYYNESSMQIRAGNV